MNKGYLAKKSLAVFLKELENVYGSSDGEERLPLFLIYEHGKIKKISYSRFMEDVSIAAKVCGSIGENRIGMAAGNSYFWIVSAVAVLLAGKQLIMLDVNMNDGDFIKLLRYADTQALITTEDLAEQMDFIPGDITVYSYSDLKKTDSGPLEFPNAQEATFMCFTSGTSKSSKGVVISAESLSVIVELGAGNLPGKQGERYFVPIPLHHIYAFTSVFHVMRQGGIICLGSSLGRFKAELQALDPHVALLVPSMLRFIMERKIACPSLYCLITGGSRCPEALSRQAMERWASYYNFYGLSETLGWICNSVPGQDVRWLKPLDGIQFLTDKDGEVGIRLPAHMREYYKKPEETAEVLKGDVFWTGDSGIIKEDGCVCIQGRLRDTIVLENGEKIHAEDKDQELMQLPHVKDAAVFSYEGGLVAAIVPDDAANWEEICRELECYNQKFASFYRIRKYWQRVEEFPRTSSGKLKRFLLEKEYAEQGE